MKIRKDLSSTFMIANLLGTILVIAIHYNSQRYIDSSDGYNWNYLAQEFFTNGICRVSVPFFALISGFFIFSKVNNFDNWLSTVRKKVKTLILPYVLGSLLIFIASLILKLILWPDDFPSLTPYLVVRTIVARPASVQFWFLRDLIILTIVSPAIFNLNKRANVALGVVLAFLWLIDIQPFPVITDWYLINIETLFYFWLGGQLYKQKCVLYAALEHRNFPKIECFMLWFLLIWMRIMIDPSISTWYVKDYTIASLLIYKIGIVVGIISLIFLSEKLKDNKTLIYLSGLTTFAYLFHLVPLSYIRLFTGRMVSDEFLFYINFPIATVLIFSLAYIISTYCGSLYAVLTGGRNPNKALRRM